MELPQQVSRWAEDQRERLALGSGNITVEPVLNWGGFVKSSFTLSAGEQKLHLKLAPSHDQAEMRRWFSLRDVLEARYRAPRIVDRIDLPGTDFGGLIFEHVEGQTWDVVERPELVREIIALLRALHSDHDLATRLGDRERSFRKCWELRYREQFEDNLRIIRSGRPPFVSEKTLQWMESEARSVLSIGREHPALEGFARAPCHWDLWPNNVIVSADDERWWVLDWDGLSVGDEAEDFATAIFDVVQHSSCDCRDLLGEDARDDGLCRRVELHQRAITLDYAIDVLADWTDAGGTEWESAVRARKRQEHERHLEAYQRRWG